MNVIEVNQENSKQIHEIPTKVLKIQRFTQQCRS